MLTDSSNSGLPKIIKGYLDIYDVSLFALLFSIDQLSGESEFQLKVKIQRVSSGRPSTRKQRISWLRRKTLMGTRMRLMANVKQGR